MFSFLDEQEAIALSIVEAEYISTAICCSKLLWIKHQLQNYNLFKSNIPILCDNIVIVDLSKNPIMHSHAKHIEIKHHFIRDHIQKGTVELQFISIEDQLADLFTKSLTKDKLISLREKLGMFPWYESSNLCERSQHTTKRPMRLVSTCALHTCVQHMDCDHWTQA